MKHIILAIVAVFVTVLSLCGENRKQLFSNQYVTYQNALFDMREDTNYCKVDSLVKVIYSDYEEALKDCKSRKDSCWTIGQLNFLNSQAQQTRDIIANR